MATDTKDQVEQEIKFGSHSTKPDESTGVASCSQFMVFVKYVHLYSFKEELSFLFPSRNCCKSRRHLRKSFFFLSLRKSFMGKRIWVLPDGAPAMLGTKSGFQRYVKTQNPRVKGVNCMIHRYASASKTLSTSLHKVLNKTVRIVNHVNKGALNSRLFKQLCIDIDADHHVFLFYANTRWLSRGNVTKRVFKLRNELKLFFELEKQNLLHC